MTKASLLLVLLVLAFVSAGCWGDDGDDEKGAAKKGATQGATQGIKDPYPKRKFFHTYAEAAPFAGPAPVKSKFTVTPFRASGAVRYRWRFDDGTTSREQNPTHTFKRAGTYRVIVDAKDEGKGSDRWNLVLGVWPPSVWNRGVQGLSKEQIKQLQRDQAKRTVKRRDELRAAGLPVTATKEEGGRP
jgi:hypothetical protein